MLHILRRASQPLKNGVVTAVGTTQQQLQPQQRTAAKPAKHIVVGDIVIKENESIYDAYLDAEEDQVLLSLPEFTRATCNQQESFLGANGISANTRRGAETVLDESHITGSSVILLTTALPALFSISISTTAATHRPLSCQSNVCTQFRFAD